MGHTDGQWPLFVIDVIRKVQPRAASIKSPLQFVFFSALAAVTWEFHLSFEPENFANTVSKPSVNIG